MIIRIGDLVFYYKEEWVNDKLVNKEKFALVDGTEKDWWVIKKHLSVHRVGDMGAIINIEDVFSIIKREDLGEWWEFI